MCAPIEAGRTGPGSVTATLHPAIDFDTWTSQHVLRNGTQLCVRPLRPDDRAREVAFMESLSERTRYLRLMSPLRYLPPHLLDQLMSIDYHHSMAFVATLGEGEGERSIGLARYGATEEPETAELGITVTDAWQRQGVARLLISRLLQYAAAQGLHTMVGWVLYENQPMLALARACGFHISIAPEHGGLQITRALDTPAK